MDRQTVVMQLRPYRASDFEALYQIDQACFPAGVSYSREELGEFIGHRSSNTWVAEAEQEIAGFLVAGREPGRVGHIITLDVAAPWRRRGVGSALMDAAEDWAALQRSALIYLETAEDNTPAQRFYAARGYEKFETIEGYYANGRAAWVMVKRLEAEDEE
jgi:ribosomal-protein-alanine N-acetyltransferase